MIGCEEDKAIRALMSREQRVAETDALIPYL